MKRTARYSTGALLAVCASFVMIAGVAAAGISETLAPQHKIIIQQSLDEPLILSKAPKESAKGSSGKGKVSRKVLKACKTECKPAYRKCSKKCYNTEDDIACKVACKAIRASCIDTCAKAVK